MTSKRTPMLEYEDWEKIIDLLNEGVTPKVIAQRIGCRVQTIYNCTSEKGVRRQAIIQMCKELGKPIPKCPRVLRQSEQKMAKNKNIVRVLKLREQGKSFRAIADAMSVSMNTVAKVLTPGGTYYQRAQAVRKQMDQEEMESKFSDYDISMLAKKAVYVVNELAKQVETCLEQKS